MRGDEIRATFSGWKLPNGQVLPGKFEILLSGKGSGRNWRYYPQLMPTRGNFYDHEGKVLSFAESKLGEGKAEIAKMFQEQIKPWSDEPTA